jgi:hypothetical protein
MPNPFFEKPILNSPYECPQQHWELDSQGQPTQRIIEARRRAEFITPIPKPKKRKKSSQQQELVFDEGAGLPRDPPGGRVMRFRKSWHKQSLKAARPPREGEVFSFTSQMIILHFSLINPRSKNSH